MIFSYYSFNPSFSMDKSGSFLLTGATTVNKDVSILVFQWISLEVNSFFASTKNEICFNPSFSMDKSGSYALIQTV